MFLLGLLGRNISHSLSPIMHAYSAECLGFGQIRYQLFSIAEDVQVAHFLEEFWQQGGAGLNITSPYKNLVAELVGAALPAVNTLVRSETGWKGGSTDGEGFVRAVAQLGGGLVSYREIVILGLGGAVQSLLEYFAELALPNLQRITILQRASRATQDPYAVRYRGRLPLAFAPFSCAALAGELEGKGTDTLLIQGTSAPQLGNNLQELVPALTKYRGALSDLVYSFPSALLTAARQQGLPSQDGLAMLIEQGRLAQELWWGKSLGFAEIYAHLKNVF